MTLYSAMRRLRISSTYLFLILLSMVMSFPLFWMVMTSVKPQREVFTQFLPRAITFANFDRVWNAMNLPLHLGNSLYVAALVIVIVVITSTLAGYAFGRMEFPRRNLLFYVFISAMMIPAQAILIPMFSYLNSLGLLNTQIGLGLSMTGGSIAFATFLMRSFFKALPSELGDAGKIDGCNDWGVFRHVYLPLSRPGIATVVIFQFMGTWNEFMFSTTFIRTPTLKTIQPALYQVVGRYAIDYTALSAGLLLAIVPILIVFMLLQKQFIKGMTAGALKG